MTTDKLYWHNENMSILVGKSTSDDGWYYKEGDKPYKFRLGFMPSKNSIKGFSLVIGNSQWAIVWKKQ